MKILIAAAALLPILPGAALAASDCDGHAGKPLDATCLQLRQESLQDEIGSLRKQVETLREMTQGLAERLEKPKPPGAPASAPPGWIADDQGCKVWNLSPSPNETIAWTGPCKGGIANGRGTLIWYLNGTLRSFFTGTLRNGHYHRGLQAWSTGDRFEGEYRNDRAEGRGTFRKAANGEVYSGLWTDGCFRDGPRRASVGAPLDACMR